MVHPVQTKAFQQPTKSQMIPNGVIDGKQILHAFICFFLLEFYQLPFQHKVMWYGTF